MRAGLQASITEKEERCSWIDFEMGFVSLGAGGERHLLTF